MDAPAAAERTAGVLPYRPRQGRGDRPGADPGELPMSRRPGGDPVLLLRVAAAALAGGALAVATLRARDSHAPWLLLVGLVVLVAVFAVLGVATLGPDVQEPVAPRAGRGERGLERPAPQPSGRPRASVPQPPGPRVSGPRVSGPRVSGPRESGPRESGPRVSGPRESGPRASGARGSAASWPGVTSPSNAG